MRLPILRLACVLLLASAATAFAQRQKVIKDPTEYNAYVSALNLTDPAKKAAAMEAFVARYPASVVKIDALEQAMAGWQQAGDQAKVENDAARVVALDKGNVRALAVLTVLERARAARGDATARAALRGHAAEGLRALPRWQQPEGVSKADFARLRGQIQGIFEGAAGFAALQEKDYATARAAYLKAVQADPGNLEDVYQLAIAELQMTPLDATGFWHIAKAMALADAAHNAAAVQSIAGYGKAKYARYHGSEEGWEAIVAAAAKEKAPPTDFAKRVTPAK